MNANSLANTDSVIATQANFVNGNSGDFATGRTGHSNHDTGSYRPHGGFRGGHCGQGRGGHHSNVQCHMCYRLYIDFLHAMHRVLHIKASLWYTIIKLFI